MLSARFGRLAIIVTLMASACGAQGPDPVSLVQPGKPFLWDVSGPGTMYILGSYWRECPEDMPPAALERLRATPAFVRFTKPTDANRLAEIDLLIGQLLLPKPHSLLDWLTWDELTDLENKFATGRSEYRMELAPNAGVRFLRPGIALRKLLYVRACGISGDLYVDAAKQNGKRIVGVETREALPLLIDDDRDGRELKTAIGDKEYAEREHVRMRSAYRAGDETAFVDATEPLRGFEAQHREAWISRLADEAKSGPIFVELPIAELVGRGGVLAGLTKMGYIVTRE